MRVSINDQLSNEVEPILAALGVDLATSINMFLSKVKLTNSIPFTVELPSEAALFNARAHDEARANLRSLSKGTDPLAAMRAKMNARKVGADMNEAPVAHSTRRRKASKSDLATA